MLDTKKIKQSSALQEWRETFLHDVPRGPRRGEVLHSATCSSVIMDVHCIMHGLLHGLAAQSSTPMYSMEISDISLPSSQAVKPLLLALANCLESECLILEKNEKQRLVDAAEEDSGSVAKTDGNVLLEMEKKEARAAAANRERQSSQLLQENYAILWRRLLCKPSRDLTFKCFSFLLLTSSVVCMEYLCQC